MKWQERYTEILASARFGPRTGKGIRTELGEDLSIPPLHSPILHDIPVLVRHRCLQMGEYSTKEGNIKIFALTEPGIDALVESGFVRGQIASPILPHWKHLTHDLAVAMVLRRSAKECERSGYPYYFFDELELKKAYSGKGKKKGERSYPDFELCLAAAERQYRLNNEIDMGTETVLYVMERKLTVNEGNILFICRNEGRIKLIADACRTHQKYNIVFSTLEDFRKYGLFKTAHWRNIDLVNVTLEKMFAVRCRNGSKEMKACTGISGY
jgi:hypothetical protein